MSEERTVRRIKIIGNNSGYGTKIIDCDTGQEIHNVRKVAWVHEAGSMPVCVLELVNTVLEGEGEVQDLTTPIVNGFLVPRVSN